MYEFPISADAASVGKSLAQLSLPGGALVLLIRRDNRFIVPRGETVVEAGDDLLVFYDPIAVPEVEEMLTKTNADAAADAAKAAAVLRTFCVYQFTTLSTIFCCSLAVRRR